MEQSLLILKQEIGQLTGEFCNHREVGLGTPVETTTFFVRCPVGGELLKITTRRDIPRIMLFPTPTTCPVGTRLLFCPTHNEPIACGLSIEVIEEPLPPVGEIPEEPQVPWKPIIIIGSALVMLFLAIGISRIKLRR